MEICINGEQCVTLPKFTNYFISESGRLYKKNAWKKSEREYLEKNPKAKYVKEIKHSVGITKGHETLYAGITPLLGNNTTINVSRTVASLFLIRPHRKSKSYRVIHKDGNIKNAHYSNLEYIFHSQLPSSAEKFKLSPSDIIDIKKQLANGITLRKIADQYKVSDMQIHRIKTGENWGNGKRKILAPVSPFEIEDGKMRRFIATFDRIEIPGNIKKTFYIKRDSNDPTNNVIIGILNGYKLSKIHKNITRAKYFVNKLNEHFFDIPIK